MSLDARGRSCGPVKNLTPAMRQYLDIKSGNGDAIVFFRMGDFYEMFFDDAVVASRLLGIALTSRDREKEIPMCGVPYHSAGQYIARLVREGHKVAICEQTEDASLAKGIVERSVTRLITPGIALEDELLDPNSNNFIVAVAWSGQRAGLSFMDVLTGDFRTAEFAGMREMEDEIKRLGPRELILDENLQAELPSLGRLRATRVPTRAFDYEDCVERLASHFKVASLDGMGCAGFREGIMAAGALLSYVTDTQKRAPRHIDALRPYFTGDYLVLDHATRRNLEITQSAQGPDNGPTLFDILNMTRTSMGARRLKHWLSCPLRDVAAINERLDAVSTLLEDNGARLGLMGLLSGVYDMERLSGRVELAAANPRDLVSLKRSLEAIPGIKKIIEGMGAVLIKRLWDALDPVPEAATLIERAIAESPPVNTRDGGIIRDGYSQELDGLRAISSGGKDWIARMEKGERERTGINSLKVGYNRVFGYYIEVPSNRLKQVPAEYMRKQTLVNAERFITPELKEYEAKVLGADERSRALEHALFSDIRHEIAAHVPRIQASARALSTLDCLSSLAQAAFERGYSRPEVNDSHAIMIREGRHPVVEAGVGGRFVPNDISLDCGSDQIIVLTGPNMAGKSTFMRQTALIVLMAQAGSFVPAAQASIGAADRIFTRVGASDDLARGQSTFMVEMNETANILNNATPRSLVILDEIGRGTSTFDGLSIAWAVAEYLHDHAPLRPRTLFATHYHELTELSLTKERVKNYNMSVKESDGRIIFLRKVVPGGASRSYGIQVARLAGLPSSVTERAGEILRNLEKGELDDKGRPRLAIGKGLKGLGDEPLREPLLQNLFAEKDPLRERLSTMDPDSMSPLEALKALYEIKRLGKD